MFEDFFENNAPVDEEKPSEESREQIRTAVMERISRESEDKKMKHRFMRPFIIVAAAVSASAASLVTANAATDGALIDTITKPFTIFLDGEPVEVEAEWQEIEMEDGENGDVLTFSLPDSDDDVWISTKELGDTDSDVTISYYRHDGETVTSEAPDAAGDIETITAGEAEAYADGAWESSEDAKSIVVNKDGTVYYYDGDIETIRIGEAEADTTANKDVGTIRKDETGESPDTYYYQYDGEKVIVISAEEFNAAES